MKQKMKATLSFFLVLIMLLAVFPLSALAADNESVLTSISHPSAVSGVVVDGGRDITLAVPYSYDGNTVDLANGLDIGYSASGYTSVSASFPSGSAAEVDGDWVDMAVSYLKPNDATLYETDYNVFVVRAEGKAPAFSGTIAKTAEIGTLALGSALFTAQYDKNDGEELGYIKINGSNPSFGKLMLNGAAYSFGSLISINDLKNNKLTFVSTAAGAVSYTVKAYAGSDTGTVAGTAALTITVTADDENAEGGTVTYETDANTPRTLVGKDFADAFKNATTLSLAYIKFQLPAKSEGTFYYNFRSAEDYDAVITSGTRFYTNDLPDVSHITFVPAKNFKGTVTIPFLAYDASDTAYEGELKISVAAPGDDDTTPGTGGNWWDIGWKGGWKNSWGYGGYGYGYDGKNSWNGYNMPGWGWNVGWYGNGGWCGNIGSGYFKDVGSSYGWASGAIDSLYSKKVITGYGDTYNPSSYITRGDFILMIARAFNLDTPFDSNFSDVSKDSYYYSAIGSAKKLGLAEGDGSNFNPNKPITRQDAIVLLERAIEAAGIELPETQGENINSYADCSQVASYARTACSAMVGAKIVEGDGKNLNPTANVSRAEIAVLLYRVLSM